MDSVMQPLPAICRRNGTGRRVVDKWKEGAMMTTRRWRRRRRGDKSLRGGWGRDDKWKNGTTERNWQRNAKQLVVRRRSIDGVSHAYRKEAKPRQRRRTAAAILPPLFCALKITKSINPVCLRLSIHKNLAETIKHDCWNEIGFDLYSGVIRNKALPMVARLNPDAIGSVQCLPSLPSS